MAAGNSSRRQRIAEKPNKPISLWGIVKNFIGKDMSRVSMPVNFFEPLSFLQRLTEDFDYAELLDCAAAESDDLQLAYVVAFAISSYSSTCDRVTKPFNPLLGETYECDRSDDLGWKCISEQVSHHPPISALHCEGKNWVLWQELSMTSKFKGKFIRVAPIGISHLLFPKSKNHYTWNKIITTVHNIILGNLWIDQTGSMIITNHKNGWKGIIEFVPYNYYNKDEQRCVRGTIVNSKEEVKLILSGNWDNKIQVSYVISADGSKEKPSFKTGPPLVLWERRPLLPDSKKFYYFTLLACQLNESEDGVAPTDSRLRPDQRLMEDGNWDEANTVKVSLEESQRKRKREHRDVKPVWFHLKDDPLTGLKIHVYDGDYWGCKKRKDWSKCADIFNTSN